MTVKNIGILFETLEDAQNVGNKPLEFLDHWREPNEIEAIRNALDRLGFNTILLGTPERFANNSDIQNQVDFIFTLSVGYVSRFRQANGAMICELLNVPYTGGDPYSKILGQNKHLSKSLFDRFRIPNPKWSYVYDSKMINNISFPSFPLIVKPACEGTSVGIYKESLVTNKKALHEQIEYVLNEVKLHAIVEQFIVGKEFKIGFIGNQEIIFKGMFEDVHLDGSSLESDFLHYNAKKEKDYSKIKIDHTNSGYAELLGYCNMVYQLFQPVDYGIFDIRQDQNGNFFLIEFNADATLHPERSLAKCCELNNVSFEEMIEKILISSFKRQGIEWN